MLVASISQNRSKYLDNICGLLIIHMIFTSHLVIFCKYQVTPAIFVFIGQVLSFFMSWFFFKSGMFYKETTFYNFFHSGTKRFIIPYCFFNFIGGLCDIFLSSYNNKRLSIVDLLIKPFSTTYYNEATYSNLALWFLLSIFIVKLLFLLSRKININVSVLLFVFLFAGSLLNHFRYHLNSFSFTLSLFGKCIYILIPYYFGNICYGFAFYSLGFLLKEKQFNKYFFILCVIIYMVHFFVPCIIDVRSNETSNYTLSVIYNIAGIIVFNNIFRIKLNHNIKFLSYIGKNSMEYFVTHFVFMSFIFGIIGDISNISDRNKLYLYLLGCGLTILFLIFVDWIFKHNKIRWMVGD